ncbi:MAG: NAD(P)-dependent glycerol-3-phosphate dehydrogenase [Lachnospiraceae bacterium]|nr:NAD(P)-dependent glycerol-3-phosphate dehydrogenase [Lachnospiraceae bacterium]
MRNNILILGSGTWGVTIANLLANNGNNVFVWGRNKEDIDNLNKTHVHKNLKYLNIDNNIKFIIDYKDVINDCSVIIYAITSNSFREVAHNSIMLISSDKYLVSLTKGMEDETLFTMSEILEDELKKQNKNGNKVVVLSGPTHAEEVAKEMPTMIVSASSNLDDAKHIQDLFMNDVFRVYTNTDIKGVETCAAFKNVIALASGILYGLGYGDNIRAALITRGLAEMVRVGEVMGCAKETFYGLAGIGDMIVTAFSEHSRNFKCGELIGKGISANAAIREIGMVVEGINFLPKAMEIKNKFSVELPVCSGIYEIVFNNVNPKDILKLLMTRSKKSE